MLFKNFLLISPCIYSPGVSFICFLWSYFLMVRCRISRTSLRGGIFFITTQGNITLPFVSDPSKLKFFSWVWLSGDQVAQIIACFNWFLRLMCVFASWERVVTMSHMIILSSLPIRTASCLQLGHHHTSSSSFHKIVACSVSIQHPPFLCQYSFADSNFL